MIRECKTHGRVPFWKSGRYWKCSRCSVASVNGFRRRRKLERIAELGGRCSHCGYDRSPAALQFHHKDESLKDPRLRSKRHGNPLTYMSSELWEQEKPNLELICANCHAELHWGVADA